MVTRREFMASAGYGLLGAASPTMAPLAKAVDKQTPQGVAPGDPPNIVLILLDDVGFGDTATFGGMAETSALDRLATGGLRYNRFHTTALCSPTRAALLSGRNHHRVGFGAFGGSPARGYTGRWPRSAASIAEVLKRSGYSTAAFGKWHNTPFGEVTPIGPFDRWPTSMGFEYFFGDMLGNGSQWEPVLWRNTQLIDPVHEPGHGHLTQRLVDDAIRWVRIHESLAPSKPFFLLFSSEGVHTPHHAPGEWIERYSGRFDAGWDVLREKVFLRQKELGVIPSDAKLTPRPPGLPAWDSLSGEHKRLLARQMEVYAAFVSHTDHEIGRLLDVIQATGRAKNTLVVYIVGDNGGDAQHGLHGTDNLWARRTNRDDSTSDQLARMHELGGPAHWNAYAAGWAWLGSTPFQWMKLVASHFGGTRNPMVISWPRVVSETGKICGQFAHVTDIAPTLYEAAGIVFSDIIDGIPQQSLDGVSLVHTFFDANAPERHRIQYFEANGNRAIYADGWLAAVLHRVPWSATRTSREFARDRWELYRVSEDFSQARDVADEFPGKLREMKALFDAEAVRNDVYPLGSGSRLERPVWSLGRKRFRFAGDFPTAALLGMPDLAKARRIEAEVAVPHGGSRGAILAAGSRAGGFALYMLEDRLVFENNVPGRTRDRIMSPGSLPTGPLAIRVEVAKARGVDADSRPMIILYVNGLEVANGRAQPLEPDILGTFDVGKNVISPVSDSYAVPARYTGTVHWITFDLE
jgi:arylsulfatase A-like enzyme